MRKREIAEEMDKIRDGIEKLGLRIINERIEETPAIEDIARLEREVNEKFEKILELANLLYDRDREIAGLKSEILALKGAKARNPDDPAKSYFKAVDTVMRKKWGNSQRRTVIYQLGLEFSKMMDEDKMEFLEKLADPPRKKRGGCFSEIVEEYTRLRKEIENG